MALEQFGQTSSAGMGALRGVLDTVPVGIAIFALDGSPRLVNRSAREILDDLASVPLPRWIEQQRLCKKDETPLTAAEVPLLATLDDGKPRREVEVHLRRPNGSMRSFLMSSEAVVDPSGEILQVACALTPTTALEERQAEARQAMKMETIGTLAASLAGPFNDALTAIHGYCELAKARLHRSDPVRHVVSEIQQAGERATMLTGRLLAHGEREVPIASDMDLDTWLKGQLASVRSQLGDHITLEIEPGEEACWVRADSHLLEQVLADLVANARDALGANGNEGGRLRLSTGRVTIDEGLAELLGAAEAGTYGVLSVSDTGGGMEERILPRVFEPFFTTKPGTLGLGLATVDRLVRSLGGHVRIESRWGEGSTFHVGLPLTHVPDTAEDDGEASSSATSLFPDTTVLLVEDDPVVRDLVRQVLEMEHMNVIQAYTGPEGLSILEDRASSLDLLISDVVLPGMGGDALARRVREQAPELRILLMSGCSDADRLAAAFEDETTAFLAKPFSPDDLLRRIRGLLRPPRPERDAARDATLDATRHAPGHEADDDTGNTDGPRVYDLDLSMHASAASLPAAQDKEFVEIDNDDEIPAGRMRVRTPPIV